MHSYIQRLRTHIGHQCLLVPGVRAILLNDHDEVLLQHRTDVLHWGLPAGAVELEETALEALNREVLEETALNVLQAEPMMLCSGPTQRFVYPNGDILQGFALVFIVREWTGEPHADGVEGSEVRFWPLHALPRNLVSQHRHTLKMFQQYQGRFLLPE